MIKDNINKPVLTFIIPIRHPDNAPNWNVTIDNLGQTIRSIANQTLSSWQCIIVVNEGVVIPNLPENFDVCYVNLPPNILHRQGDSTLEEFRDAVRLDKGRRILAGLYYKPTIDFFMVVDDDDFIHNELVSYVSENSTENGWFIDKGYIWNDKGCYLYKNYSFNMLCGTSHIVRKKLLNLPIDIKKVSTQEIKDLLGSHVRLKNILDEAETPLLPLPFFGSVYRIGNIDGHSQTPSIFKAFILKKKIILNPLLLLRHLSKLRILNKKKKKMFGFI